MDVDGGIGASTYQLHYSQDDSPTDLLRYKTSETNFAAQFGMGGNWVCRCWILGFRGFIQYNAAESPVDRSIPSVTFQRDQKMPWDTGIEAKAVYAFRSHLRFFGTAGVDWGWNDFTETGTNGSVDHTFVHTGLRVSGGGEQWLTRRIFIRESYAYTWFNEKSYSLPGGGRTKLKPKLGSTLFMIGVLY